MTSSSLPSLAPPSPLIYGRLRPSHSTGLPDPTRNQPFLRNHRRALLALAAVFLVAACSAVAVAIVKSRSHPSGSVGLRVRPARAIIALACGPTQYPTFCEESLAEYAGARAVARPKDLVPISVNVTLRRLGVALRRSAPIGEIEMDSYDKSVYDVCMVLMDDSYDMLNRTLAAVSRGKTAAALAAAPAANGDQIRGTPADVMTWLSATLTNQDTCNDALSSASDEIKRQLSPPLENLTELASNTLTIYATTTYAATYGGGSDDGDSPAAAPSNNRRLLSSLPHDDVAATTGGFPSWVSRSDRMLLESTPAVAIKADVVVSKSGGGNGTVKTIGEAIAMAPQNSQRRFVIYIKAGQYEESNLIVGRKITNLWLIGDGMGKTVITGSISVDRNRVHTFNTATFGVIGERFVARDITFANEAGPEYHQAVAFRVGSDESLIYRCEIKAYQDTLYTVGKRQFFRECDIYGTVDFIFGNSVVVFQNSTIYSRKPMPGQTCVITAQGRSIWNQTTGMSFHACEFRAVDEGPSACTTLLGRPWGPNATVVYMMSYLGDHIDPRGWSSWGPKGPGLDWVYYGEYNNNGPGAGLAGRVKAPGVHTQLSRKDASNFTVENFISRDWVTQTGVEFQAGLTS